MKALIVKSKTLNYITLLYTEKESFKKVVLDCKENYSEKLTHTFCCFNWIFSKNYQQLDRKQSNQSTLASRYWWCYKDISPLQVAPCRWMPTIRDVQWLHLYGNENVFMINWWVLVCAGRLWEGLMLIGPNLAAPQGWSYTCSGAGWLVWMVLAGLEDGWWLSSRLKSRWELVRESVPPRERASSLMLSSSCILSWSDCRDTYRQLI